MPRALNEKHLGRRKRSEGNLTPRTCSKRETSDGANGSRARAKKTLTGLDSQPAPR